MYTASNPPGFIDQNSVADLLFIFARENTAQATISRSDLKSISKCLTYQNFYEQPLHNKIRPYPVFYVHGSCSDVWFWPRCSDVTERCVIGCCWREDVFGKITSNVSRRTIFDYYHSFFVLSNFAERADVLGVFPNHLRERREIISPMI